MTTGKRSRTADHPTRIRGNRTTSRAMAGSGNRGQHASLKVAVVWSMTIETFLFSAVYPTSARASSSEVSQCRTHVLS